ncbi:MAG: HdeD family acid-resistance protein [Anaerolineae bacterium]|nr:HdeD family acid-resistance protein [Anaerolineae bacterium]
MSLTQPQKEAKAAPWWLVLLEGISLIIIGIFLLTSTAKATVFIIQVMGIYWIISGIFQLIGLFMDHTAWGWKLFAGIISILAGVIVVGQPLMATVVVLSVAIIILGIQGLVYGGIGVYQAFKGAGWGAGILGAISILFGLILLGNTLIAAATLPWVLGVFGIIGGIFAIVAAFKMK